MTSFRIFSIYDILTELQNSPGGGVEPATIFKVGSDLEYKTIQSAIDATSGYNNIVNIILVYPGIYTEDVSITSPGIYLKGFGIDTTYINGSLSIIYSEIGSPVTVSDITIVKNDNGNALTINASGVVLQNSKFSKSEIGDGFSLLYNNTTSMTIDNCKISNTTGENIAFKIQNGNVNIFSSEIVGGVCLDISDGGSVNANNCIMLSTNSTLDARPFSFI